MTSNIVRFDEIRAMAGTGAPGAGVVSATYQPIGFYTSQTVAAPFTHAMRLVHFINDTNGAMMISFDGTTDNVMVPPNTFSLYDLTNNQDANESFRYQKGTQLYVKYLSAPTVVAGSTNDIYMVTVYGKGE